MADRRLATLRRPDLEAIRRTRRRPRPTQFDYLHIRRLVEDLRHALDRIGPVTDVLDVYCGTRPYDDLLPPGAQCVGLDVPGNPYGTADVVSDEFLPFADASFDLVTCFEAFHYVEDPVRGIAELARVLRPGGWLLLSVPFVWEYDRTLLEHRYTGPELAALLADWDDVRVVENGGRAVVWATVTGTLLERARRLAPRPIRPIFAAFILGLNGCGAALDALERRGVDSPIVLPMNLLVTARLPQAG